LALSQREVEIQLRFVEAKTGRIVFEDTQKGITTRGGSDAAGDLVLYTGGKILKTIKEGVKKGLPGKTLKKVADMTDAVADVDLTQETNQAIRKLLRSF